MFKYSYINYYCKFIFYNCLNFSIFKKIMIMLAAIEQIKLYVTAVDVSVNAFPFPPVFDVEGKQLDVYSEF